MNFAYDAAVRATEDLDGRLDVAEEELSEARATIERFRTDMTALRASEVAAVARASKLALDLQTAQSEAAEARRDIRHRDETIASLRLTVRETSSACDTLVKRCERAESARDESAERVEALRKKVEQLTLERGLIDAERKRDMDDLRARLERERHEAAKNYDETVRLKAEVNAARAAVQEWSNRADFAEGEISAALHLPPTMGVPAGELDRVLRQTREDLATALRGVCPRGFVVVTLAQWDDAILSRESAERGTAAAVAAITDLREQLREIRRTVIATVRGEEYAATLTEQALDEYAESTGEDVANLAARMRAMQAKRDESRTAQKESSVKMLRHRGTLAALLHAVRQERAEREAWLASLHDGACGNPPPAALVAAEAATGEVLRAIGGER